MKAYSNHMLVNFQAELALKLDELAQFQKLRAFSKTELELIQTLTCMLVLTYYL